MKTPTLEELKEYFKDAEIVRESTFKGRHFKINWDKVEESALGNWIQDDYFLYNERSGYAEIISYKEGEKPIFQIFDEEEKKWYDLHDQNLYRIKPKTNYDKEIEALQNKAKENGIKVIINFEKL